MRALGVVARSLALCVLVAACALGPARPQARDATVRSGGIALHTRYLGSGSQVIVLLHGGPGLSLEEMTPYRALLTPARELVAFDQRGSGRTGRGSSTDLSLAAQVADVEAVRRSTRARRVWVIGQSWGGLLAAAYVAAHPDRVAGLALIDAPPPDLAAFQRGQQAFATRLTRLQRLGLVPSPLPPAVAGSCLPALTAELPVYAARPDRPPRPPSGMTCTAGTAPLTYAAAIRSDVLGPAGKALSAYPGPALVVSGALDPFGPSWPQAWARLLPRAQRLTVSDAGHEPLLEQPRPVLRALDRFLSSPG